MAPSIAKRVTYMALSLFYGWTSIMVAAFNAIRFGRAYFRVKKRPDRPAELSDPKYGRHEFVTLASGLKMHYVANGSANKPMLLMIHGFPECWYSWHHQLTEFKSDFYVVAIDLRGYGESDKPMGVENYATNILVEDIREFLDAMNRQRCTVACHDWGGVLGYMFTAKYPDMVEKLIVMNAPHHRHFDEVLQTSWRQFFMSWYMFLFQLPILPELLLLANDLQVFDRVFKSADGKHRLSKEQIEVYKYYFSRPGAVTPPLNFYRARFGAADRKPWPSRISVPTLVIWGKKDVAPSSVLATGVAKFVDNFQFRIIENATHFVQIDQPDVVNAHMREFLQK